MAVECVVVFVRASLCDGYKSVTDRQKVLAISAYTAPMRTLFILLIAVVLGQAEALRVPWNKTPEVFAGNFVTVHLASGTQIGGTWINVTPSAFTMKVSHSSNRTKLAEGVRLLPRSSIVKVGFRKRQVRGRVIGTLAGFFGTGFATAKISQALNPGDPNLWNRICRHCGRGCRILNRPPFRSPGHPRNLLGRVMQERSYCDAFSTAALRFRGFGSDSRNFR